MLSIRSNSNFPEWLKEKADGTFVDVLDCEFLELSEHQATMQVRIARKHLAPNGFVHGGAVVAIADTITGIACRSLLPDTAKGMATIELKTNFLGTAAVGEVVHARARLVHKGKTTQVWDCELSVPERDNRMIALFRCTQAVFLGR